MRHQRIKLERTACYHIINRVHGHAFLLDDEGAEKFRELMRQVEYFTGIEVMTYCIMTNHFHLLVRVPERRILSDEELFRRLERVSSDKVFAEFQEQWNRHEKRGDLRALAQLRAGVERRMYDLSMFMKELKQRFTQWYNWRHERMGEGSLWSDRFKSVLCEGRGAVLATMAAYIDLNPVRAGMVEDPQDYRWCGYGEAVAGGRRARAGLGRVVKSLGRGGAVKEILATYRLLLFGEVAKRRGQVSRAAICALFEGEGMRAPWEMGRRRVKWFTNGMIIGGGGFVASCAELWNERLGRRRGGEGVDAEDGPGWRMYKPGRDI